MVIVLFALGTVAVLAGLGMIGYGIPNYEFGLGNLLIGSGVTTILGGFIIICLAVGVAQLQRIAELLRTLPAPRVGRPGEPAEPGAARPRPAPGARPPMPSRPGAEASGRAPPPAPSPPPLSPRPLEPRHAEPPRQAEPHPPIAPAAEAPIEVQVERPRPRFPSRSEPRPEPPLVEETEEVTLSPRPAPRPYASPLQRDIDFAPEPRREADTSPSSSGQGAAFATTRAEPPWRSSTAPRPDPAGERNIFAGLWEARSEPVAPEHEATAPASDEEPVAPPVAAMPPRPEPAEPRPVSILKSGVVDGMAYTLYSDGSIEAELPEGTVRFASINELREHLEKHEELEKHS